MKYAPQVGQLVRRRLFSCLMLPLMVEQGSLFVGGTWFTVTLMVLLRSLRSETSAPILAATVVGEAG